MANLLGPWRTSANDTSAGGGKHSGDVVHDRPACHGAGGPGLRVPGVWFLSQLIVAKLGGVQCRGSRGCVLRPRRRVHLRFARGRRRCGCGSLPAIQAPHHQRGSHQDGHRAGVPRLAPVSVDQTADQSPCPVCSPRWPKTPTGAALAPPAGPAPGPDSGHRTRPAAAATPPRPGRLSAAGPHRRTGGRATQDLPETDHDVPARLHRLRKRMAAGLHRAQPAQAAPLPPEALTITDPRQRPSSHEAQHHHRTSNRRPTIPEPLSAQFVRQAEVFAATRPAERTDLPRSVRHLGGDADRGSRRRG
jgi:hypothetical protein